MIHKRSASSMWLYLRGRLGIAIVGTYKFYDYLGDNSGDLNKLGSDRIEYI